MGSSGEAPPYSGGHLVQGGRVGMVHQMGIDLSGGGGGGVAKSLADLKEGGALFTGHGSEGMAQAVEGELG